MKKMSLVLAAVMATGMILSACGGNKSAGPSEGGTTNAANGEATTPGGESSGGLDLAVQVGPNPETIDPALNSAADGANVIVHAFEPLLIVNSENKIVAVRQKPTMYLKMDLPIPSTFVMV